MVTTSSVTTRMSDLPAVGESAATTSRNTLGKDDFLKLLTTQMRNQDPLNPMENTEFIAQLAQFSSVEELKNVGSRLDTLLLAEATTNQLSTAALAGKQVLYKTDQVQLTSGSPAQVQVELQGAAASTTVLVLDPSGRVVRTLDLGAREAGVFTTTWDGRDGAGELLPSGAYTLSVAATDREGADVTAATRARGTVSGVTFDGGVTKLLIGGAAIPMSQLVEISVQQPPQST